MDGNINNQILVKHTAAVHISNVLTLNQRKIANILLKNAYSTLISHEQHTIQVRDLLCQLGWKASSNSTESLKDDLRILNTTQLEWNIFKRDRKRSWSISTLLASAKIENGTIFYSYSSTMRQALYNPNIYAKLDLMVQQKIRNKHSIVLWEYIMCELSAIGKRQMITKWLFLDDLRKILGLQNSSTYNSFNALHRLIKPAIEEINQKSEINVFLEFQKECRSVRALRFVITRSEQISANEYAKKAELFGISVEQIKNDLADYGPERVHFAMEYTRKQISDGKVINNVAAFYKVALRENWGAQKTSENVKAVQLEMAIEELTVSNLIKNFLMALKNRVGDAIFNSWFADAAYETADDKVLIIKASSSFKRDYILSNFTEAIKEQQDDFLKFRGLV